MIWLECSRAFLKSRGQSPAVGQCIKLCIKLRTSVVLFGAKACRILEEPLVFSPCWRPREALWDMHKGISKLSVDIGPWGAGLNLIRVISSNRVDEHASARDGQETKTPKPFSLLFPASHGAASHRYLSHSRGLFPHQLRQTRPEANLMCTVFPAALFPGGSKSCQAGCLNCPSMWRLSLILPSLKLLDPCYILSLFSSGLDCKPVWMTFRQRVCTIHCKNSVIPV